MSLFKKFFSLVLLLSLGGLHAAKPGKAKPALSYTNKEAGVTASLSGSISNSTDVGINTSLLNNKAKGAFGDRIDAAAVNKTKIEVTGNIKHNNGVEAQVTARTKLAWGNAKNLSTSTESIKFGEAYLGGHSHTLEPNVLFVREAWVAFDLDKLLNYNLGKQSITVGLFPFSVGRGISLGDAFGVNPVSLGFYGDRTVDQHAPGVKWSGNAYLDSLKYDIYTGIDKNSMTNIKDTGNQIYDRLIIGGKHVDADKFARGFGHFDLVFASRLKWDAIDNKKEEHKVSFEPYFVYNHDNTQKLEFTGDARSRLGTFGLAAEFQYGCVEFGCEGAFNRGHQEVFAWDRNHVQANSSTGALEYSHLYSDAALTTRLAFTADTNIYRPTSGISSALNSTEVINSVTGAATGVYNAANRFRDYHKNKYRGFMFVADASVYVYKRDVKVSATAGITSGDTNPNTRTNAPEERRYKGFVSQQELYSGKRVKSIFVMGPASSLNRLSPLEESDVVAKPTEGFTNLIFAGMGATFAPECSSCNLTVSPNAITFWQDSRANKFNSTEKASNRLGVELNTFMCVDLCENAKFIATGAVFLPGKHYADIKGTGLDSALSSTIKKAAAAGVTETLPTMSNDAAYSFSVGMEYRF